MHATNIYFFAETITIKLFEISCPQWPVISYELRVYTKVAHTNYFASSISKVCQICKMLCKQKNLCSYIESHMQLIWVTIMLIELLIDDRVILLCQKCTFFFIVARYG